MTSSLPRLRALLRVRHFPTLVSGRWVSQAADGAFQVGLAAYVLFDPQKASTASEVAAILAVTLLPFSFLGPFTGAFIDRRPRQLILVWSQGIRTVVAGALAIMVAAGVRGPGLFAVALVGLSINRFFLAALSAVLPLVVPEETLLTANALSTTGGSLAALAGGSIGFAATGLVTGSGGRAGVIAIAGAAYALSCLLLSRLPRSLLGPGDLTNLPGFFEELHRLARDALDGAVIIIRIPRVIAALGAVLLMRFFVGLQFVAILLLVRNYFNFSRPEAVAGFILAVSGAGVLLGALITPSLGKRLPKERIVAAALALAGLAQLGFGLPYRYHALVVAAFLYGIVFATSKTSVDTIVQESIPDAFRGRAFAFYDIGYNLAFVVSALAAVAILPQSGRSVGAGIAIGLAYLALAGAYWLWKPRRPALA
ncbi:MAG: MFS transporter [Actinomycetota bacterium]